jgi:hypothetical protein
MYKKDGGIKKQTEIQKKEERKEKIKEARKETVTRCRKGDTGIRMKKGGADEQWTKAVK